jgi:Na+-transporting methylmalonyl-CoA/oxaloacetate decarboxylase gamma subunit
MNEAFRIAGTGFIGVFFLLIILAVVLYLVGFGFQKISNKADKSGKRVKD